MAAQVSELLPEMPGMAAPWVTGHRTAEDGIYELDSLTVLPHNLLSILQKLKRA